MENKGNKTGRGGCPSPRKGSLVLPPCPFPHIVHLFTQQILTECFLCTRYIFGPWDYGIVPENPSFSNLFPQLCPEHACFHF
jgi:hypothetical protein